MPAERILIIGGTGEAHGLAANLIAAGFTPITSLAGVTRAPRLPPGAVRIGGFGGPEGLARYLGAERIAALVDASHPFAAQISANAVHAAATAAVPLIRYEREPWTPTPEDHWQAVDSLVEGAAAIAPGSRVMLSTGVKELEPFFARTDMSGIARMIERPNAAPPAHWRLIQARPPFPLEDEIALMRDERITVLVSKNAGGPWQPKLLAARQLQLPVIMIRRPIKPPAPTVSSVEAVVEWLEAELNETRSISPP